MSNFLTPIPVHIERVKEILPAGSVIDRAEWNKEKSCVELYWHNKGLKTPYSWPWPWTLAQLEQKQVPDGIEWTGAAAAAEPMNMRKVLTVPTDQTTTQQSEKVAGQTKSPVRKGKACKHSKSAGVPNDSTADASAVDGSGPATTGSLSPLNDG